MVRARDPFERNSFEVLAAPMDEVSLAASTPGDRLDLVRRTLKEMLVRVHYRTARYL